jgi:hypothetical protein
MTEKSKQNILKRAKIKVEAKRGQEVDLMGSIEQQKTVLL